MLNGSRDSDAVVELRGVTKGFASTIAVRDLSLAFRAGEVVALMGENGAGKSTLLKLLAGEYRPDAGELLLDGEETRFSSPSAAHAAGIRVVAQEPEIVPGVGVAENVYLGELPKLHGRVDRGHLRDTLAELLERHGFAGALPLDRMGERLTPAQCQLVEILRAVRPGSRLVAFDEPTSSLTEEEVEQLFALIRRLRDEGVAVVYVSHRMHEIFQVADRIVVLRDGALQGERAAAETSEDEIVRLMVGRDLDTVLQRRRAVRERVVLDVRSLGSRWHHDVSLQVRAGEVVGLAGLMGAGRSELAKVIFGDLPATRGEIRVEGHALAVHEPADVMRAGVGFAPEDRKGEALLLSRSVRENIALASLRSLRRGPFVDGRAERRLAQEHVDRLGIVTTSLQKEIRQLSGGNQQKAVLARWLARAPRLLLLDEPTRGIDVGAKTDIYRLIDEMANAGVAILLISSELPELLGLADRILVMREGAIAGELPHGDASEEALLRLAMPAPEHLSPTTHERHA